MLSEHLVTELNDIFGLNQCPLIEQYKRRWHCVLLPQEIGDFHILPLTTAKQLNSEGFQMRHCVARYATKCASGEYQVFSIRDRNGNRIATLGLSFSRDHWKVDQCFGADNSEVSTDTVTFVDDQGLPTESREANDLYYVSQEVARLLTNCHP